jgi:hypothetical protein
MNIANNLNDGSEELEDNSLEEHYFACQECCCIEDHRSICEALK